MQLLASISTHRAWRRPAAWPMAALVLSAAAQTSTAQPTTSPDTSPTAVLTVNTPNGLPPTRFQFCQAEVSGLDGAARKNSLRECLHRRADGESIVAKDCKRQAGDVPLNSTQLHALYKQCMQTALSVPYADLPKRPPRVAPSAPANDGFGSGDGSPVDDMPAAAAALAGPAAAPAPDAAPAAASNP
jgi:hypothetical protein